MASNGSFNMPFGMSSSANESVHPESELTSLDMSGADYSPPNETFNQVDIFSSTQIIDHSRLQNCLINFNDENLTPIYQVSDTATHHDLDSSLDFLFEGSTLQDMEVSNQTLQVSGLDLSLSFLFDGCSLEDNSSDGSDHINFSLGISFGESLPSYEVPNDFFMAVGTDSLPVNESTLSMESDNSFSPDTQSAHIIMSYKAKQKLAIGDFLYVRDKTFPNRIYWKCENVFASSTCCKSRLHTDLDINVIKVPTPHNHPSVPGKAEVEELLAKGKEKAITSSEKIDVIIEVVWNEVLDDWICYLPQRRAYAKVLRDHRNKAGVKDLEPFRFTKSGKEFLRHQDEEVVVFVTDEDLKFMAEAKDLFGDGTFKVAPPGYKQVYTLHAYYDGITYPCVYAVLKDKKQETYEKMIDIVLDLLPVVTFPKATSIMTDFEKSAMNAFQVKFPGAQLSGCYFHLGQSVWRHINGEQIARHRYKTEPDFAIRARMFCALAFVPTDRVIEFMEILMEDAIEVNDEIQYIARYFQDTYTGQRFASGMVRPGTFPFPIWNMFDRVRARKPRTNNSIEGWHNSFGSAIHNYPV